LPARVRTKKRKSKTKNAQHPELIGLGLLALGIFLSSVLYLGWSGGMAGGWIVDGFKATIGAAAYVAPIAFLVVGALMVARSSIADVIGALLLSGASAGALVRRSGHAVRRAHDRARRARPEDDHVEPATVIPFRSLEPPVDVVHDFPDVVGDNQPSPLLIEPVSTEEPDQPSLFDVGEIEAHEEYTLPDRAILRRSSTANEVSSDVAERTAAALVQTLKHFGIDANIVGQISGPRVTRYELQLAPG